MQSQVLNNDTTDNETTPNTFSIGNVLTLETTVIDYIKSLSDADQHIPTVNKQIGELTTALKNARKDLLAKEQESGKAFVDGDKELATQLLEAVATAKALVADIETQLKLRKKEVSLLGKVSRSVKIYLDSLESA